MFDRLSEEAQSNPNFFLELADDVRGECAKLGTVLHCAAGKDCTVPNCTLPNCTVPCRAVLHCAVTCRAILSCAALRSCAIGEGTPCRVGDVAGWRRAAQPILALS